MTTTPAFAAPRLSARTFTSLAETSRPGIYLRVVTSHWSGVYSSRLTRAEIKDSMVSTKIDAALFHDPAPLPPEAVGAPRFSAKRLAAAHMDYLERVEAELPAALAWAERY